MLTEEQKNVLPSRIVQRIEQLNDEVLKSLGERMKEIGELLPSDAHKLQQLKEYGADINRITYRLAEITELNIQEIYNIYEYLAEDNSEFAEQFYEAAGKDFIPYKENAELREFVRSMANQTAGEYINMSQTTGFMVYDKSGNKVFTKLSKVYHDVIDEAVTAISSGAVDYQSQMRKTITQLADSGLRTKYTPGKGSAGKVVDYASGYSRRLDAAVRQNILWGVKQVAMSMQERLGEEFGADGFEIDYHSFPRPTHAEMGGQQYVIGAARMINGKYFESFDSVSGLLEDYGCLHFKWAIICGVSVPNYTDEELARLKAKDEELIEYEGKKYTGYEATQAQRKLESKIRNAKDRYTIAKASGDDTMRRVEQEKISILLKHYKNFSDTAGLPYKADRLTVADYKKALTKRGDNDIINVLPNADKVIIPIEKFTYYALNPLKNEDKAKAFEVALGYTANNASKLIENIRENINKFNAVEKKDNGYGKRYEVLMQITGINGKMANVKTAWIIDKNTKETRLISAYVTKKKIKEN